MTEDLDPGHTLNASPSSSNVTVGQGDMNVCLALNGNDVQSWMFTTVEKKAKNVCNLYRQNLVGHAKK